MVSPGAEGGRRATLARDRITLIVGEYRPHLGDMRARSKSPIVQVRSLNSSRPALINTPMLRHLVLLASALSLGTLTVVACSGDDAVHSPATDGGSPSPEAGSGAPDAVGDTGSVDAGSVDTGLDASAPVTMTTVTRAGDPVANVTLVLHDANGAVVGTQTTDATGHASWISPATSVTALFVTPGAVVGGDLYAAVTIVGIEPGDVLQAIDTTAYQFGSNRAVVPTYPPNPPAGTASYSAQIGRCGAAAGLGFTSYINDPYCQPSPAKFPILVEALDDGGTQIGFTFEKVADPDGGMDDVGDYVVDLAAAPWSTNVVQHTVTATNVAEPADLLREQLVFSEYASGAPVYTELNVWPGYAPFDGGVGSIAVTSHVGYADFVQYEMAHERVPTSTGTNYVSAVQAIATRADSPTSAQAFAIDFSQLLPEITASQLSGADAGADGGVDPRPSIAITSSDSLASTDGAFALLQWSGTVNGTPVTASWTFVLPPSTTSFRAPELPASAAAWAPSPDATFAYSPVVEFMDATFLTDYRDLRQVASALAPTSPIGIVETAGPPTAPPLPQDGTLRLTAWSVSN